MTQSMNAANEVKVTFKSGSSTANLLNYANIRKRRPFKAQDVKMVLAGKFPNAYEARRSIQVLVKNKCLQEVSKEEFLITSYGQKVLTFFAYRDIQPAGRTRLNADKLRIKLLDEEDKKLGL
jgi:hypothetical protein